MERYLSGIRLILQSQSPQTGQFNSYDNIELSIDQKASTVSIPSNGSIQFLLGYYDQINDLPNMSQSPQTGQFNSYIS